MKLYIRIHHSMRLVSALIFAVVMLLLFSGCATNLVPSYDKAIIDGIVSVNQKTMEFFASISDGASDGGYDDREGDYSILIGHFDSLVMLTRARPIPKNSVLDKANEYMSSRGMPVLDIEELPSSSALNHVSETIAKMRDTDKKQGITKLEVQAFKHQVVIFLDQALTYEGFLPR